MVASEGLQRLKKDLFSEKERIGSGLCVWNILRKRLGLRGIGRMLVFFVLVLASILGVVVRFCLGLAMFGRERIRG